MNHPATPARGPVALKQLTGPDHPPGEVCRNCRFWHVDELQDSGTRIGGVAPCRREPPRLQILAVPAAPQKGQLFAAAAPQMSIMVQPFPVPSPSTPADFWCGEFAARPRDANGST